MINVVGPMVKFKGDIVTIAAEYAILTHTLVENCPDIMDIATEMIKEISEEAGNDKTDINHN